MARDADERALERRKKIIAAIEKNARAVLLEDSHCVANDLARDVLTLIALLRRDLGVENTGGQDYGDG